jgi:alkylated DNA nucleotide flippase Atl1
VANEAYDEQVLGVVALIPPGHVMSYGDIAEYLGAGGPRQVGQVMSRNVADVPWWRVIHADGSPPRGKERGFHDAWRAEATPMRPDGTRVDMRRARWDGRPAGDNPAG